MSVALAPADDKAEGDNRGEYDEEDGDDKVYPSQLLSYGTHALAKI